MAINLEFLQNLPIKTQEEVLRDLSKSLAKYPIEIDGKVYLVEEAVSDLIESLYSQCQRYIQDIETKN